LNRKPSATCLSSGSTGQLDTKFDAIPVHPPIVFTHPVRGAVNARA
jgi:hypothetical protein